MILGRKIQTYDKAEYIDVKHNSIKLQGMPQYSNGIRKVIGAL